MTAVWQTARITGAIALCFSIVSCGGGGDSFGSSASSPSSSSSGGGVAAASNVASVIVDAGPEGSSVNTLFTSVHLCVVGSTTSCQTIDHIQVDTGSSGLRILASALNLPLQLQSAAANNTSLVECTEFVDGYSWGPVALADLTISGEAATAVPIQVIGDSRFATVPADCSNSGAETAEDTVMAFGANGVLGVGVFAQDCGETCVNNAISPLYYACSSASCAATVVPLADQVVNPVALFPTDNNGVFIQLPSVPAAGALSVTGSLIFGIDTQSNNQSGAETVLTVDPNSAELTAIFNGQTLSNSFIDSGSNGNYFTDGSIPVCTQAGLADFYCPPSTLNLSVTLQGKNALTATESFSVGNTQTLLTNNPTFTAEPLLGGTNSTSGASNAITDSFDFGLSFFYGRRVATALEAKTTSAGTGPYVAF